MTDYVIVNDKTKIVVTEVDREDIRRLFPLLHGDNLVNHWEVITQTTCKLLGNSLYKKV